ncbi:centromere-associated E isoform X1 [Solea senegalensis]|uniref:Centromere-associated protein E n=1 Tax=Solea senegalensis TaxID=28829 RepID=A0AAV6RTY7_SOLSE|nr:centromere-associated E isoform X1 [Solea senegalensis]
MGEESAVKVCVRVRPLIAREESVPSEDAEPVQLFWKTDKKSVHQIDDGNTTKSFSFDRVFAAEETTNHLYQDIAKPLVVSTVEGYNGTIFAYGQTSSGKTFTMMGSDHIPGVIPLAVEDVFQTIKNCPKKEFLLRVSYMEIYNETVTDLLVDSWKRKPLEVREAIHKNIYVADLTEELVTSPAQALAWIRKGEKNRHYGKTKMNQRSSRSHAIFRMILESRERSEPGSGENADGAIIVSHLNLVDLAGSERASQTGAEGTRFKEGCNINRSLFTLGQVIKKLTDESQKGFTNYRDSKLTRILQNSLGGNAKTVIICTITPAALDETLSTLQFASTAKKMKNDPHVTEVSDDGALLKRYRNEIVDLKRRLQEVSSVTQTTVTEKEVLAHLLQEKDQLQREQEDRIRNLTRLMVTSSDLVPVKKMPKRRVTWGGKMVRLARPSLCGSGSSDLSFADPFTLKRKAGHSCLMEMTEDDEDFDVHWDVPDEPSDEMETTQGSVAVRSFEYSPKDASPDWMSDISQKVSNLELQLEMESQQKEEAMTKVTVLESRVSELQLQLQTEAQLKHEALGNMETAEKRAAEQELLQLTEAQQKLEAVEKVTMLDLRVVDLERQLESQSHALTENEQMRREFAETIQLLETLASEKDLAITERDYLRQELGLFIERIELLEKEKAALTQELEEKRETDEFKSLEDEFRKEHENELKNEMLSLKKAFESSEVKCLEFQNKVETLSEELKKKSEFAEELQSMSGKDLVQEVAKLRRSLDDAEGVSRDTKKEWAFLRSHNIALEEMNATFTANHKRMEAEVNSLHSQLEKEKSHSKNMQSDLQKELNIAFNENTKLTALLDGKVPKELIDSVELERTVTSLSKELTAARQEEEALRAQLQELASLQTLPHEMDNMVKQLEESEQQRALVVNRLKEMQQLMQEEKLADSEVSRNTEEDISRELQEQELQCVQAKKATEPMAAAQSSADETEKLLSTVAALSAERDQLKIDLQENIEMMIENQEELRTALEKIRELKEWIKQLETAQTSKQDASLTHVCPQLEALQKQVDDLQATLQLVNEQKHELERDLQHNMKMAAEVQSTLQPLQEQLQEQNQRNEDLERQSAERQAHLEQKITETESLLCCLQEELQEQKQKNSDLVKQRESDSQQQTKTLTEELENTRAERDTLLFEKENGCQLSSEKENLLCRVMSLSEERDQLQETLHTLRQEKQQLRAELEDKIEMMQCDFQLQLCSQPQSLKEEQEDQQHLQIQELEKQLEKTQEEVLQLRSDLQENVEQMIENQDELRASQEKVRVLQDQMNILRSHVSELESRTSSSGDAERLLQIQELQNQIKTLTEELENMKMERDHLLSERTTCCQSTPSESEETREKQQLGAELEDKTETLQSEVKTLTEKLQCSETERDDLRSEVEASCRSTSSDKEKLLCLSEERDHLQETLNTLRQEKQQLRAELEDKMETLQNEMAQLNTSLMTVTEQKNQLEDALQQIMDTASTTQEHLQSVQEELFEQKQKNADLQRVSEEKESALVQQIKTLAEKMEKIEAEQNEVSEEKEKLLYLSEERDQLQETLNTLRQEKQQLSAELEDKMETLQNEVKTLTEKLQCSETERDDLRSEVEASCRSASSDKEKLLCLSEERDHLQETLNTLRQEKQQLRAELEDKMETLQNEMAQLNTSLMTVTEQKNQLEDALQQIMDTASTTQEHLQSVQEELFEQKQKNADLQRVSEEKESALVQQIKTLAEKMEKIEAEQNEVSEEKEKLLYLSEERDQLQETLNTLRQEKQQLSAELEDKMETLQNEVKTLTEKLQCSETERDDLRSEVEASCRSASSDKEKLLCLSEERDHLQETLNTLRQEKQQLRAELEDKLETISAIEENLSKQDQSEREQKANLQQEVQQLGVKETLSSRLHDSTEQLQESFRGFKSFIDTCHCYSTTPRDRALSAQGSLKHLSSLPKATMDAYTTVCRLGLQTVHTLGNIIVCLQWHAQDYRDLFEELVQKDLAVFEEKRVQDVLLCRAQAPSLSLGDEDFHSLWGHRLTELLGKRLLYKQKMDNILERLWANIPPYPTELSAEVRARERFTEQLKATYSTQSLSFSELDTILNCELERRAALTHNKEMTLQSIKDEQRRVMEELSLLVAHANSQLKEERSKSSTLLQGLDGVPLKAELSLLKDNQQLVLQLQQMEKEVKTLKEQNVQLQEAQVEANSRVSKQKEATQLLQTELLDSRAHNHEKETTIQTLRNKLQQQEKKTPPSAAELEKLQTKMFQMEVELSSASDKHQQEIHRMNTVLKGKEDSLRKLKEILRSQQQGEGSFLKGEDLHTKLTNPRGLVIRSSFLQDKAKLEEEVKQLKLKITELESLVSTLHTEIGKWKSRAIKLKVKSKAEVDRPSSPCTPTKRCLPVTSESSTFLGSPKKFVVTPKKILESSRRAMESPNVTLPDSPKSRFFDVCGSLELLSTSCPKPFFDNSSLGTIPEATQGPDPPGVEKDADVGAAKKEEWWPQSPKQEDMCQTQ